MIQQLLADTKDTEENGRHCLTMDHVRAIARDMVIAGMYPLNLSTTHVISVYEVMTDNARYRVKPAILPCIRRRVEDTASPSVCVSYHQNDFTLIEEYETSNECKTL
jgi:hypothetical protein